MTGYFIRRLLLMIPTLIGVTAIAFTVTRLVPGGPLERTIMQIRTGGGAGGEAGGSGAGATIHDPTALLTPTARKELEKQFNLDKPGIIAYGLWLKDLTKLDLGDSFYKRRPVWNIIIERFPVSLTFGLSGFFLAYMVCIPLGISKALRHGSVFDFFSSAVVFIGYSIPGWAAGALLLLFLCTGQYLDWFPLGDIRTDDYDNLPTAVKWLENEGDVRGEDFGDVVWEEASPLSALIDLVYHMVLPVFCYTLASFAALTILTKNSLMENLGQDYVRTAFAKGLAPRRVIFLHALRNSLIPLVTGLGHALSVLMAGSFLIELVFNIDGVGMLGFKAIVNRDYPIVLGVLTINSFLLLLGNILSDFLYAVVDPRIRFE